MFGFPVWINRCGVMAGAGQFGTSDQGVLSFWINSWMHRRPLKYYGFGGLGQQVRDCLHPSDLVPLLIKQTASTQRDTRVVNFGGGRGNSFSLAELSAWCTDQFGDHIVAGDQNDRHFDIPWLIMDSSLAAQLWDWRPATPLTAVLDEIAHHAEENPKWLEQSGAG